MAGDDERGGSVVERWVMTKFTLSFVAVVSFFSFLYSYFSGLWSYNIQLSTLVFSLFAHSVDRKYMFLICNGIVAFLVKNLTFGSSSSSSSSSSGVIKSAEDGVKHVGEVLVQENVAEYVEEEETEKQQQEMKVQDEDKDKDKDKDKVEENIVEEKVMEVEEKVEDESEEEEEKDEEEVEVEENKGREDEVISDASVSTEELNHKFEEFIRKMKEEIRIEAQQQQQLVAAS